MTELDRLKARAARATAAAKAERRRLNRKMQGLPAEKPSVETARTPGPEGAMRLARADSATSKKLHRLAWRVANLSGRGRPVHDRSSFFLVDGQRFRLRWDGIDKKWKEMPQ